QSISTMLSCATNACFTHLLANITDPIAFKNASVLGYNANAIFACGTDRNNLTVKPGLTAAAGVFDSIISVTLTGPDAANFTPDTASPGFDKRYEETTDKTIPIIFSPSEINKTVVYNYTAHILVHSPNNLPITYLIDQSNTASVLDLIAT